MEYYTINWTTEIKPINPEHYVTGDFNDAFLSCDYTFTDADAYECVQWLDN